MNRTTVLLFILGAVLLTAPVRADQTKPVVAHAASKTDPAAPPKGNSSSQARLANIEHWIVIYQENWSFDSLYGKFPGADGLNNAAATVPQVDRAGRLLATLPDPSTDSNVPPGLPVRPYDLSQYLSLTGKTEDLAHRFYTEQLQIDNGYVTPSHGSMDKFVAWSDNGSLVQSYYDASNLPEGLLAGQYLMCDRFFHAAFGGSLLNHQYLIAAAAPRWQQPLPASNPKFVSTLLRKPDGPVLNDGVLSLHGRFVVNTVFSAVAPHPKKVPADQLLRAINNVDPGKPGYTPTIGDRLDAAGISWRWYAGGWKDAVEGHPGKLFQYHHHPFAYFAKYAPFRDDGSLNPERVGPAAKLQDESQFYVDLAAGKLPRVSFIKFSGEFNEHPGYASVLPGQQHVADIVHAVQNGPLWAHAAIIILYDEHGGRWDHVPPPQRDAWGPGTRVPAMIISPYTWRGGVQHATYDSLSVIKTFEERYRLEPLGEGDRRVAGLADCFQDEEHASLNLVYLQPDADRPDRNTLVVGGTPRSDRIRIALEDDSIVVHMHSQAHVAGKRWRFKARKISRIEVLGQGGGDEIRIEPEVTVPAVVLCGSGDNQVRAGGGPTVVVGGPGNNEIEGGNGRNVLIGGPGRNHLKAGTRGDILIAGRTDYDANLAALREILAEWSRPDASYADRVAHLSGKLSGGLNGASVLDSAHVHPAQGVDRLEGGGGQNWYFARPLSSGGTRARPPGRRDIARHLKYGGPDLECGHLLPLWPAAERLLFSCGFEPNLGQLANCPEFVNNLQDCRYRLLNDARVSIQCHVRFVN